MGLVMGLLMGLVLVRHLQNEMENVVLRALDTVELGTIVHMMNHMARALRLYDIR